MSTYARGLQDLGNSVYAYLQPDGSWGWSNAGLIVDGGTSLLVDTLYDLSLTADMLRAMRAADKAAVQIDLLVNTHSNGDHCNGNQLVAEARNIVSRGTAEEMKTEPPPSMVAAMLKSAPPDAFIHRVLGSFDFSGISVPAPDEIFEQELLLTLGEKRIQLLEVGPAHTRGDTLVYVPSDRVVFTGDIVFAGGHPVMWAGPTKNWLRACDRILAMDVETIVPGHGPLTNKQGVMELKNYFAYIYQEASKRYVAGMPAWEAARDIPMDRYATWQDGERIVVNIATIYRELSGETAPLSVHQLFEQMGRFVRDRK